MVGDAVVVWLEVPPSRTAREPAERRVDHVGLKSFTVEGLDAVFNRSTGRSKTIRDRGELSARTFVAVAADSARASEVLGRQRQQTLDEAATRAVQAWLTDRSPGTRRAAIEALHALEALDE